MSAPQDTRLSQWLDRLDVVEARLVALAVTHPSAEARTKSDSATGERWEAGQVWAHLGEFGDYWLAELRQVLHAPPGPPPTFGRVKSDPVRVSAIETGRAGDPADHLAAAQRVLHALRAQLLAMSPADWSRVALHSTLGELDVAGQLQHFLVGHYEEHADQLDELLAK